MADEPIPLPTLGDPRSKTFEAANPTGPEYLRAFFPTGGKLPEVPLSGPLDDYVQQARGCWRSTWDHDTKLRADPFKTEPDRIVGLAEFAEVQQQRVQQSYDSAVQRATEGLAVIEAKLMAHFSMPDGGRATMRSHILQRFESFKLDQRVAEVRKAINTGRFEIARAALSDEACFCLEIPDLIRDNLRNEYWAALAPVELDRYEKLDACLRAARDTKAAFDRNIGKLVDHEAARALKGKRVA